MSRTYHKQKLNNLTGSKRFDYSCRCNGGCGWCYSNRFHSDFMNMGKDAHRRNSEQQVIDRELEEYYIELEELDTEEFYKDY